MQYLDDLPDEELLLYSAKDKCDRFSQVWSTPIITTEGGMFGCLSYFKAQWKQLYPVCHLMETTWWVRVRFHIKSYSVVSSLATELLSRFFYCSLVFLCKIWRIIGLLNAEFQIKGFFNLVNTLKFMNFCHINNSSKWQLSCVNMSMLSSIAPEYQAATMFQIRV